MSEPVPIMGALPKPKIPISLVLGSGGARGYAHIGVIEELIAQGFDIRSIAGSSMGALVGGIHAAGKLDAFRDWVLPMARYDVFKLLDITITGGGFIKGNRIINAMREQVGDVNIEDLPISYTAVAVDLDAHREVWFSRGSLFDAIRASIAIPTIFRPHRYQGRLLVDGGLLNPLPVSPTLRDHTVATIAVDVNATPEPLDGSPAQPLRYSAGEVAGEVPAALSCEVPVVAQPVSHSVQARQAMCRIFIETRFSIDAGRPEPPRHRLCSPARHGCGRLRPPQAVARAGRG